MSERIMALAKLHCTAKREYFVSGEAKSAGILALYSEHFQRSPPQKDPFCGCRIPKLHTLWRALKLSTKCRQLEAQNGELPKKFPVLHRLNVKRGLPSPLHNHPMRVEALLHGRRVVYSLRRAAFCSVPLSLPCCGGSSAAPDGPRIIFSEEERAKGIVCGEGMRNNSRFSVDFFRIGCIIF